MQYDERKPFTPEPGKVYTNNGGGRFRCLSVVGTNEAVFENVRSGWICKAHGIGAYPDETIDWVYSTGGHFNENRR